MITLATTPSHQYSRLERYVNQEGRRLINKCALSWQVQTTKTNWEKNDISTPGGEHIFTVVVLLNVTLHSSAFRRLQDWAFFE